MNVADIIIFTVISSIEYISIMILIFTIFRFQYFHLKPQILFISIALSYVSYSMRTDDMALVTPFVQLLLLILFLWMIIKVHPFYAIIMGTLGYITYGLLQGGLLYLFSQFPIPLEAMTWPMYGLAILTSSLTICISLWLKRRNLGFSFVPTSDYLRVKLKKQEVYEFMFTIFFSVLGAAVCYGFYLFDVNPLFLFFTMLILVLCISILFYLSHQKEMRDLTNGE